MAKRGRKSKAEIAENEAVNQEVSSDNEVVIETNTTELETEEKKENEKLETIESKTEEIVEKKNEDIILESPKTEEVVKEEYKKPLNLNKKLEYPPSAVSIMNQLKMNPGYDRLTTSSLLRIASSKLRSRYFFGRK